MNLDSDFDEISTRNLVKFYRRELLQILRGEGNADLLPKGVLHNLRLGGILWGKRGKLVLTAKGLLLLEAKGVDFKKGKNNIMSE